MDNNKNDSGMHIYFISCAIVVIVWTVVLWTGPHSPLLSLLALTPCVHTFLDMCAGELVTASADDSFEFAVAKPEDWGIDIDDDDCAWEHVDCLAVQNCCYDCLAVQNCRKSLWFASACILLYYYCFVYICLLQIILYLYYELLQGDWMTIVDKIYL